MSTNLTFPNDENGEVLQGMQESGDDLSKARNIEFQHVFPTKAQALDFLTKSSDEAVTVSISWYAKIQKWNVQVAKHMVPSHAAISQLEASLEEVARAFGGNSDGWGCLEVGSG